MTQIYTYHNQFEDGIAIETNDGNRLEAIVTHLPGSESLFHLAEVSFDEDNNPIITDLITCPVQAA